MGFIYVIFSFVCFAAMWRIFSKAGVDGWKSLIPFYNVYVMFESVYREKWYKVFLLLIPFYNLYYTVILLNKLSSNFGKGTSFTVGLFFLFPIFSCILAFGDSKFIYNTNSDNDLDNNVVFCQKCGAKLSEEQSLCTECEKKIKNEILEKESFSISKPEVDTNTFYQEPKSIPSIENASLNNEEITRKFSTKEDYRASEEYKNLPLKHKHKFNQLLKGENFEFIDRIFYDKTSEISKYYFDLPDSEIVGFINSIIKLKKDISFIEYLYLNKDTEAGMFFNNLGTTSKSLFVGFLVKHNYDLELTYKEYKFIKNKFMVQAIITTIVVVCIIFFSPVTSLGDEIYSNYMAGKMIYGFGFIAALISFYFPIWLYMKGFSYIKAQVISIVAILFLICCSFGYMFNSGKDTKISQENYVNVQDSSQNTESTANKTPEVYKTYYDNGKLKSESTSDSENSSIYTEYYENGQISSKGISSNSGHYSAREYYENGNLKRIEESDIVDVFIAKTEEQIYDINGNIILTNSFSNKKGIKKEYYSNKQIKKEFQYIQTFPEGDGDACEETLDGYYREYSENGELISEKIYKEGKIVS